MTIEARPNAGAPARPIKVMLAIGGLGLGGAEMVVRDLAHHLDRAWFDVSICCTKHLGGAIGEQLLRDGCDVFVLPGQDDARVDYLTALKFRRALKERAIDIVHTHSMPALLDAAPCRVTMPRLRAVHTFHYGNYPLRSWRHAVLESICTRSFDRLVAVGHEQRRRITEAYRFAESRIDVLWNGVTLAAPASGNTFRQDVATGDRLLIGTIAKLIEQKGLDDLLVVARKCRDGGLPMQFVIVGEGPLRAQLEQQRRALGLEDTVVITGWIADAANSALPEFDVFFQPSRWEAMSIAILEAMGRGKAIVATRVGDNPLVLEDGVSGLLVEAGDIDGMVSTLSKTADASYRCKLGRAAQQRYAANFTVDNMIRGYERIYRELAGPH